MAIPIPPKPLHAPECAAGGIPRARAALPPTTETAEQPAARVDSAPCPECVHVLADGEPRWWGAFQQLLARHPSLGIEGDLPVICRCDAHGIFRWLQRRCDE